MEENQHIVRYELKMECEYHHLPIVQSWTRLHSACFHETFPARQVNSIYFDTPDLDTYNDHVEGVMARRKLRFRWYGTNLDSALGNLELKEKKERIGWKLIEPVETRLEFLRCSWSEIQLHILDGIRNGKNKIFQEMLQVSRPIVLTCYHREYFVSANQQVRMTLDYNRRVYNQWTSARPNMKFHTPSLNNIIIELKSEVKYANYLTNVLAQFPLRANRHSKFVSAIDPFLDL